MANRVMLLLALPLMLAGCAVVDADAQYGRRYSTGSGWALQDSDMRTWGYGGRQPRLVCDARGICYQAGAAYSPGTIYSDERELWQRRPERWRRDNHNRRFARPDSDVTCDRRTSVCYKNGHIDKSETEEFFGNGASRRADAIRDRAGSGRVFVTRPGKWCDPADRGCLPRRGGRKH